MWCMQYGGNAEERDQIVKKFLWDKHSGSDYSYEQFGPFHSLHMSWNKKSLFYF